MEIQTVSQEPLVHTIRWVMGKLPNKDYPKAVLSIDARATFVRSGGQSEDELRVIEYLIKRAPQDSGIHRTRAYWKIVLKHLSREEALALYLKQFPSQISDAYLDQLQRCCHSVFALPADKINAAFKHRDFSVHRQIKERRPVMGYR